MAGGTGAWSQRRSLPRSQPRSPLDQASQTHPWCGPDGGYIKASKPDGNKNRVIHRAGPGLDMAEAAQPECPPYPPIPGCGQHSDGGSRTTQTEGARRTSLREKQGPILFRTLLKDRTFSCHGAQARTRPSPRARGSPTSAPGARGLAGPAAARRPASRAPPAPVAGTRARRAPKRCGSSPGTSQA